ncbi:MAG: SH3 domain-containing protein [Clostridia bacterium]|nr:SH3 domain-containing protein [Clostridia bacterium]
MAKKTIKPTPAGILFLSAIAVLVIALITVVIVLVSNCNKNKSPNRPVATPTATIEAEASPSLKPTEIPTPDPSLNPINPTDSENPDETPDPNNSSGPVINTPPADGTANPSATAGYLTEPTSSMKRNAKDGYVSGDKVNMRKGPGTNYDKVKSDIAKGTEVTMYTEQNGWWFVKCDGKYGYIKKDYVKQGTYSGTTGGEVSGTVNVSATSKIALRKDASKESQCIKEYARGEAVTIYYKSKDGKWYYVKVNSDGKKGWMYAEYVKANGKVGTKN